MHWILQDNLFNEVAYQTLLETLERFGISYSIHKVIPFIGELTPPPDEPISPCVKKMSCYETCDYGTTGCVTKHDNVICMGSYSLRHVAKKEGWYPGVFDLEEHNFNEQMKHWAVHMLNADAVVSRFEDAVFTEDVMFIRPIEDSKVFAGTVMDKAEFEEWQKKVCVLEEDYGTSLSKDTLIQVCRPKKIYAEYRFWVVNQNIVTSSLYKRGDRVIYSPKVDNHVIAFANEILRTKNGKLDITTGIPNTGWAPDAAFCLDVCETPEGMKVVEIGTINSCGFYAANMTDLVLALEGAFNEKTKLWL